MRPAKRLFLQAWVLLLIDLECKGPGSLRRRESNTFLVTEIIKQHHLLYPELRLSESQVREFLRHERRSRDGIVRGSGHDNFLRWDMIDSQLLDLRDLLGMRVAAKRNDGLAQKRQALDGEGKSEIMSLFGLD